MSNSAASPWARLAGVKSLKVHPLTTATHPEKFAARVPGSKSITNRALILAAASSGISRLQDYLKSDDSYWCVHALKKLGIRVEEKIHSKNNAPYLEIHGTGAQFGKVEEPIFIGAAGTIGRFLPGILASASSHGPWNLDCDASLRVRPIAPLIKCLQSMGSQIRFLENEGCLPVEIQSKGLAGGKVSVPGSTSSQYLSGLLLASPLARNPVTLSVEGGLVQPRYVDITTQMMQKFGAKISRQDDSTWHIDNSGYQGRDFEIEGDASTAGYVFALAALHGKAMSVENVGTDTSQPDYMLLEALEKMGCKVERFPSRTEIRGPEKLKGGFRFDLNPYSDQTPTLAALAVFADGPIEIHGVEHIRKHECDRISALRENLEKLGIKVEEKPDGLKIYPGIPKASAALPTYSDHRIAMSMGLIATKSPEPIELLDPNCVAKTWPDFFEFLQQAGTRIDESRG